MASATSCPICLDDPLIDAMLLPACGHSFCAHCVTELPRHNPRCPICRISYSAGSAVPNFSLRDAAEAAAELAATPLQQQRPARPAAPAAAIQLREPSPTALAELGIPPGLSRLACDEARKVGLRLFLLDNSGSTAETDGHILRSGERLVTCTRWREICGAAESAAQLGAAVGVVCEFHLLNPLRATSLGDATEGDDYIRTTEARDVTRLVRWLGRVTPRGVTPLAQRLRTLNPRFDAFAAAEGASGRVAFLVIVTDGAPTPVDSGSATPEAAAAALAALKRLVRTYPLRLVVRLCTDESQVNIAITDHRLHPHVLMTHSNHRPPNAPPVLMHY